jgi:hypothetical protein
MKTILAKSLPFLALLPVATANFDIYWVRSGGNGISANLKHYGLLKGGPSCDDAWDSTTWPDKDDVSSDLGVRCSDDDDAHGCRGSASPSIISEVEIHVNNDGYHWSK